jgi:putative ABC transport system permease protein
MTRTGIAISSLWSRRVAVGLTVVGIALSVAMILGVDRVRLETRENFASTVSGTDLIVGARTSPVQLLLYSVFRIGDATANIGYASYLKISSHPSVAWAVPLSLGDSHRGYRVVGTTPEFFDHIRYGRGDGLHIGQGEGMRDRFDAIIGAEVAETLGYAPNDAIVIAHGARDDGLARHESLLFAVAGILDRTGTPVDRSIHVTLAGIASPTRNSTGRKRSVGRSNLKPSRRSTSVWSGAQTRCRFIEPSMLFRMSRCWRFCPGLR